MLTVRMQLSQRGSWAGNCEEKSWKIRADEFQVSTIGIGPFARETMLYRIPYTKWSDAGCGYIDMHLRSRGNLASLDYSIGFVVDVSLVTEGGETIRGTSNTFRP